MIHLPLVPLGAIEVVTSPYLPPNAVVPGLVEGKILVGPNVTTVEQIAERWVPSKKPEKKETE